MGGWLEKLEQYRTDVAGFSGYWAESDGVRDQMHGFLDTFDVILSPVAAHAALPHGTSTEEENFRGFNYTMAHNLTGWPAAVVPMVSDYTYMDIYYRSIQRKDNDWLTQKGYIWRWDTDWFWCSKHFGFEKPAIRFLAKRALNSRTYQRLMRLSQRFLPVSAVIESVIQDVQIPIGNAPSFCDFLFAEIGITPVWVCPFRRVLGDSPYNS